MGVLICFLLMSMMPFGGEIAFGIFSLIALYDIITLSLIHISEPTRRS